MGRRGGKGSGTGVAVGLAGRVRGAFSGLWPLSGSMAVPCAAWTIVSVLCLYFLVYGCRFLSAEQPLLFAAERARGVWSLPGVSRCADKRKEKQHPDPETGRAKVCPALGGTLVRLLGVCAVRREGDCRK